MGMAKKRVSRSKGRGRCTRLSLKDVGDSRARTERGRTERKKRRRKRRWRKGVGQGTRYKVTKEGEERKRVREKEELKRRRGRRK